MRLSTIARIATTSFCSILLITSDPISALAAWPNDPLVNNQSHLKQIKADRAWSIVKGNTVVKIAVLDSGVDPTHPDLQDNLLPPINLVHTEGDNDLSGHGTKVAGILAAKGNNGMGVSGVMWNAKILPIKILDRHGECDVDRLIKGMRLAVDQGVDVVVMSVNYLYHTEELEAAVNYAEEKGVILVAASGNEGSRVGYPAAYPTVIAVGAVNSNNVPHSRSNYGPEISLMAPGLTIYTTTVGGQYGAMTGTSAAAPQVAAACALVLAKNPRLSPVEVRQLLYDTATDLGDKGWDKYTGHGLLDVNKAVRSKLPTDRNEPNNSRYTATAFPIESEMRGSLGAYDMSDWYMTEVPYDGKLTFTTNVSTSTIAPIAATFYNDNQPVTYYLANGETLGIAAKKGKLFYKLERGSGVGSFTYILTSRFTIAPDRYERNNEPKQHRALPRGNLIRVEGNFHAPGDVDWFSYYVRDAGKMSITVETDTLRMDPVVFLDKEGDGRQQMGKFDNGTPKDPTERLHVEVTPGRYLIGIRNYDPVAINGQYTLHVAYTPEHRDVSEPNDTYRSATRIQNGGLMTGTLPSKSDYDWYTFQVKSDSYVMIRAPHIPIPSGMRMALYKASSLTQPIIHQYYVAELAASGRNIAALKLSPGTYYVRLSSSNQIKYDTYRLTYTEQPLIARYRDIQHHWAREAIVRLTQKGIAKGFNDYSFRPDQGVTRSEFATMLIRSMKAQGLNVGGGQSNSRFRDLRASHWAYQSLMQANQLGIMQGYENGTMQPNRPINRAEMAMMVARSKKMLIYKRSYSSYRDIKPTYWAAPAIESLSSLEFLRGYKDGTFRPNQTVRRAEMVVLLAKAFRL